MQKNRITNKITPCCGLPFSVIYWWVSNLTLNSEADRQYLLTQISQSGVLSIDGWKVLVNSGTLETDASLTKPEFLAWFDCGKQPNCEQLKLLIESFKLGNYNPADEYGVGWTEQISFEEYGEKIIRKVTGYVGGVGSVPAELQANVGKYYAAVGGFTTDKDLATDFKPDVELKSFREVDPILKTGTVDNVDTYTVYFTDNTTTTFTVTNGEETELDVDGGALSYETAMKLLSGFMVGDPTQLQIINIPNSGVLYGGHFLQTDNNYNNNGNYPEIGVLHNVPVDGATKLKVSNFYAIGAGAQFAAIVGMKNGSPIVLMSSMASDGGQPKEYDVTDFQTISFQINKTAAFPTLQFEKYGKHYEDVREYLDENLKVLDFFLNPTETIWQELPMPQQNERDDAIIDTQWQQYAAAGTANGIIKVADLPADFDILEIEGNFSVGGYGTLWLGGFNDNTNVYDKLLFGVAGSGKKTFTINRDRYDYYAYSRTDNNQKYRIGKIVQLQKEKDSVKEYIDNHISSGSTISNEKSAQIKRPSKVLRLEFTTNDPIPVDKTTIASGEILITDMEGLGIKKFATIGVQGSSSAIYPKKNWTFALFNNADKSDSFKLRVGNWCEHSEFVFKSNWIDATHARNLISNHIWEDIVQSRAGYPKRENEIAYVQSYTGQAGRFDSGALTHVDGVPSEVYINGEFYGIGCFNLGKKRENYDLKSGTQNHIQLAAETHANFYAYVPEQWEIRNPKTPDANFTTKINAWFAANALSGQAFKDAFPTNHDVKNAVDFFLLAEFVQSPDMYTKNVMVTSWDGVKFYFLPYDMDTTFGLQWDGASFTGWTTSIRSVGFWNKFYDAYTTEIKARYAELKAKGVFTLDNVYKHADKINKTFGIELFKKEQAAWASIPSNSTIFTGFPQIYDWVKNRIIWLDSQYSI